MSSTLIRKYIDLVESTETSTANVGLGPHIYVNGSTFVPTYEVLPMLLQLPLSTLNIGRTNTKIYEPRPDSKINVNGADLAAQIAQEAHLSDKSTLSEYFNFIAEMVNSGKLDNAQLQALKVYNTKELEDNVLANPQLMKKYRINPKEFEKHLPQQTPVKLDKKVY